MRIIHTDGSCRFNNDPDITKRKMLICYYDAELKVFEIREPFYKGGSNNIAELLAVFEALRYAERSNIRSLKIQTDSIIIKNWVTREKLGTSKMNDRGFCQKVLNGIIKLKAILTDFEIGQRPRDENLAGIELEKKLNKTT